jgi:hypothetical protein
MVKTKKYLVFYSKTTDGEIDVEATSPEEAQGIVEGYIGSDFDGAREYDNPIEVRDVQLA